MVGAGATGGYFGGRLAEAGRDVTFLARPLRAARIRTEGLTVHSPHGHVRLTPKVVTSAELTDQYDVVLFSVKAYDLDRAIADLGPAVGPRTVIVPLLNGVRHVERLMARFGNRHVAGGVCLVTTTLDADGRILQLNERQEIRYGVWDPSDPPALEAVPAALGDAGFTVGRSPAIRQEMWEKWVYVAAVGAVTCLMRGVAGDVAAAPGGRRFAERVVAECAAAATACGHRPGPAALAALRATVTDPGSEAASSLYRDLCRGAPVETDHLLGDLVARAARHGVETPLLELAHLHLRVHQQRLASVDH